MNIGTILEFSPVDALGWIELDEGGGRLRFGASSLVGGLKPVAGARVEVGEAVPGFRGVLKASKVYPLGFHEAAARAAKKAAGTEARELLSQGAVSFGGDAFVSAHAFADYVEQLYSAGAPRVTVARQNTVLVVTLPDDAVGRAKLFAMYNAEVDRFDEDFGAEESPGHEMTHAEALAMGRPEAEGEWVVDDLHATDTGQSTLSFWWD
jgi:hypothetical protein